jgi:hypothetical protein
MNVSRILRLGWMALAPLGEWSSHLMADIDLNHLASQNERVLAEIARLREEMDGLRDEMNVLTAIMTRIDRWIGEQSPPLPAND